MINLSLCILCFVLFLECDGMCRNLDKGVIDEDMVSLLAITISTVATNGAIIAN